MLSTDAGAALVAVAADGSFLATYRLMIEPAAQASDQRAAPRLRYTYAVCRLNLFIAAPSPFSMEIRCLSACIRLRLERREQPFSGIESALCSPVHSVGLLGRPRCLPAERPIIFARG